MKLSKKEVSALFDRVLNLAKKNPPSFFNLRKMHLTVGLCYWTDIELDYRKDIIATAVHELIHVLEPEWAESTVLYAESRIMNTCTPLEIAEFNKILADKIYKNEKKKLNQQTKQIAKKRNK